MSKRSWRTNRLGWKSPQSKLLLLVAVFIAWWWNWQLVLANGAGIVIMLLVYCFSPGEWQRYRKSIESTVAGYNGKLIFAVAGGVSAFFMVYLAASIWTYSANHWLAIGQIVQLLALSVGAVVLLAQRLKSPSLFDSTSEQLIHNLTAADPVARLIAVRQLTKQLLGAYQPQTAIEVMQYFQLMLLQTQAAIVKQALSESIEKLQLRYATVRQPHPLSVQPVIKLEAKQTIGDVPRHQRRYRIESNS